MTRYRDQIGLFVLVLLFAVLAIDVSTGFFTIDEFIVYSGAQAMLDRGSFFVENGDEGLSSDQLRLMILVAGENGLTPQYPPGPAIFGAPLMALFGLRGLILLNAFASFAAVIALYFMAKRHFGGRNVALVACILLLFSTFFLEYAFAVWPHAWSLLSILVASRLTLEVLGSDRFRPASCVVIGVALGIGMLFRADVIVAGAAIGIALFLLLEKPFRSLIAIGLGGVPFVAAMSLVNHVKFGTYNPLSYGQTGSSATNLASHGVVILALGFAAMAGVAIKHFWQREKFQKPLLYVGALSLLVVLAAAHEFVLRYLDGFWGLIVDATTIEDARAGVVPQENGTVTFWGLIKKALGQSMPWLALAIPALAGSQIISKRNRIFILILLAIWSLPFLPKEWHGGMGSNMRYFLPLLPILCALAAGLVVHLWQNTAQALHYALFGAALGIGAYNGWEPFHPTGMAGAHQILATWVLLATTLVAIAYTFGRGKWGADKALLMAAAGGAVLSANFAYDDFHASQWERKRSALFSEDHLALPGNSLAFVPARFAIDWALKPGQVIALPHHRTGQLDTDLIDAALARGKRVFVWPHYMNDQIENDPRYLVNVTEFGRETHRLSELLPAGGAQ